MKDAELDVTAPLDLQLDWFLSLISATSLETIFNQLVGRAREWMQVPRCALWWLDGNRNGFRLAAVAEDSWPVNLDANFLPYETASALVSSAEGPADVPPDSTLHLPDFDLTSCLATRIHYDDRLTGILIAFPKASPYQWSEAERDLLLTIARTAAEICQNFERHEKRTRLVKLLQEMSEKNTDYELNDLVLREGKALLGCDRAVVRGVNLQNGHLTYERSDPNASDRFSLPHGKGVTGMAVANSRTYRIDDVTAPEWRDVYRSLWPDLRQARSELAVPILLRKYRARIKKSNEYVERQFGVLNFESSTVAAFSSFDQYCVETIAERMAPVMERIEYDKKLGKVRKASEVLATERDWELVVDTLLAAIREALGYEFVSLSIVDKDAKRIRCTRVVGVSDPDAFRRAAVHELDSNHVLADVVRRGGHVEVPAPDDPRLSPINRRFGLDKLIRVFVPLVAAPRKEVMGSITAGYDRTYRKHIYWRDVQLLRILATFAAGAMELWQRGIIDMVSHEMNAPLNAIRSRLERLRTKRDFISEELIDKLLRDMEIDALVIRDQVKHLEDWFGGKGTLTAQEPRHTEPVLLFGEIIFKTISQMVQSVRQAGLDPKKISYSKEDIYKIKSIYVDRSKISQVIVNLFTNAIKYVGRPEDFKIEIGAEERPDHYVLKFSDWGLGVPEGLEERIFEERFRGPSGEGVEGHGLGLTIARQLMREHGGDLFLKNRSQPTEFHLTFPKRLRKP